MDRIRHVTLVSLLLLAAALEPRETVVAQTAATPSLSCSSESAAYPMAGHYTGPWHSDGDYHFAVFNTDLDLKITIDGTLDAAVDASGRLTGAVSGTVDAPITHDGGKDVSSGYGTISGQLTGVFSPGSALVVLSHPVIDMHLGTFVGGGYTVERFITMPDYQFPASQSDCISSQGSIAETDFPVMNVTSDGTGGLVDVPGRGAATGRWQLSSDATGRFQSWSQQIDAFTSNANALLAGPPLSVAAFQQQIENPLQTLVTQIRLQPDVARCLLARLGAWEGSALAILYRQAPDTSSDDLTALRHAGDALRSAQLLNQDCQFGDNGALQRVIITTSGALDRAMAAHNWSDTALLLRESLLLQGKAGRTAIQQEVNSNLHAMLNSSTDQTHELELARLAYALGDGADATSLYHRLLPAAGAESYRSFVEQHHKHKKHKKKTPSRATATATARPRPTATATATLIPTATATPTPTATATPTPTATATPMPAPPRTLQQVLDGSLPAMTAHVSPGAPASLGWLAAPGAVRYVVTVTGTNDSTLLWAWSGATTSVTFGDTTIDGLAGSAGDSWPIALPHSDYAWSVLAFNGSGQIVGVQFRVQG